MKSTPTPAFDPVLDPNSDAGTSRDAIGLGQVAGKGLNTLHGTILTLESISVSFDGFKALNDLNLYIGVGELRCIIGPNGAGKTTLMDVITGKTRPSHGTAWFGETLDLTKMSEVQIAQAGIGRKFQKPTVFEALSVFENLELAQKADKSVWASLRARLNGEQRDRIDEVLETIRLTSSMARPAGLLSHGQKQFLEIGMLLVQDPQLLLLDEPVAGMTENEIELTVEILNRLKKTHTIILVEHDMNFVRKIADIVTVLEAYDALASVVRGGHPAADALAAVDAAREAADMAFLLEDVPEALAQSLEGLRQVARIVRAMKDFSHPGGGDKAPADLAALIETALVISHNEYKYVAEVETVFGDGVDAVPCDEGSIKQVVLNLVVNAAHAVQKRAKEGGPRRGRITVRAHVTQGMARVEVQDTGVGIPEAARDKVFDLFFTTKEVGSGTGQGLALAHKVVREQHEGRLGFETEVGVGTTFWFELPLG
mgnify:CR=1 FL=1